VSKSPFKKLTDRQFAALMKRSERYLRQVERERQKREAADREFFGRCNCHKGPHAFCFFHTRLGTATPSPGAGTKAREP